MEKIGIAVKSHSSTLEDADLERIQTELLSPEPRKVVEQRIKSTVIRRRAVREPAEEIKPEEAAPAPPEEKPAVEPASQATPVPKESVIPPVPKEVPVRTSIYRDVPSSDAAPKPVMPFMKPAAKPAKPKEAAPGTTAKIDAVKPEPRAAEPKAEPETKPVPEIVSKAPAVEKKPFAVHPPEQREIKPSSVERGPRAQTPPEAPKPLPPVAKKEFPGDRT